MTEFENSVTFNVTENVFELYTHEAEPQYRHYYLRMEEATAILFRFKVRACRDAHFLLLKPFELKGMCFLCMYVSIMI